MDKKKISFIFRVLLFPSFFLFFFTNAFSQTLIVTLGDSLTEGFGVKKDEAYPHLLQKKLLKKGYDAKVINGGISGSTSASSFSRLKWYIRTDPDIVILALGGNDGLRGLSLVNMKKNLKRTIELAKSEGILVLLAGMQIPLNYGKEYTNAFREVFFELANKHKIPFIPFLLKDVGGISRLNQPDGIHPNSEGHKIISNTVLKYLEPHLTKKNKKLF